MDKEIDMDSKNGEEWNEDRMDIIGQNGNEGLHYMDEDYVNHPSHYTQGSIEVIDFIEDQKLPYHLGNAVKYIARSRHKSRYEEDLRKAVWYLNRAIEYNKDYK